MHFPFASDAEHIRNYILIFVVTITLLVMLRLILKMFVKTGLNIVTLPVEEDPQGGVEHRISMIEVTNQNMRLKGKIALITGAGTGIGRATAIAMAIEGARVALIGRRKEKLDEVANEIGSDALVCCGDVSNASDIERVIRETVERFGGINVLVNNAAYLVAGTAEGLTEEEWNTTLETNVTAMWRMCRAILPIMRKAGGGSIINLSSVLGLVGARNRVAYAASKGAVTLMSKAMALDHAQENIRVNCICPGVVETEMVAGFITNAPDPEAARNARIALHPMGRFGQPADIASIAVFLASNDSSWMTGAAIPVDGGYTAV